MTASASAPDPTPGRFVSRRRLGTWGAGGVALAAITGTAADCSSPDPATAPEDASVARWRATRGSHYLIAHRGSGDVLPEHSLPAYRAALGRGPSCMELSVTMTFDGHLICLHDLTYDRTTTGHGLVSAQPASVLKQIGIRVPQLGPAWLRTPLPRVPTLQQAFSLLGGRTVLALEAKADAAYAPMMNLARRAGLTHSLLVKAYNTSARIEQARAAGHRVFAYLGPGDVTAAAIASLAGRLNRSRDYLGIPSRSAVALWPAQLIWAAVASGVPIWPYPVHRRSEATYYTDLGVQGIVGSSYRYTAHRVPVAARDDWSSGKVASGQMCRDPSTAATAPSWTGGGELTLGARGTPKMITMGQLSPIATVDYRIDFGARRDTLPADRTAGVCLTVAHPDDRYYQVGSSANGYNAVFSPDGHLRLLRHDSGSPGSRLLAETYLPAIRTGQQIQCALEVNRRGLRWQVATGGRAATIETDDRRYRGGYFHVGRLSQDGAVSLRALAVWSAA